VATGSHAVERGEQAVALTAKEYALLEFLARNVGRMVGESRTADRQRRHIHLLVVAK
jgi:DNA-binding response OmpR family regulator